MCAILICWCRSKIFQIFHVFEEFIIYFEVLILSLVLVMKHEHIISFRSTHF